MIRLKKNTQTTPQWVTIWRRQDGATAVEYSIMVAGIALAIFLAVTTFGGAVRDLFQQYNDNAP